MSTSGLVAELESQGKSDFRQGRINHITDISLSVGAIIFSFLATILVPIHEIPSWITATVAALSGLCASLQRFVDFRGRAAWYFLRSAKTEGIVRALKYEGVKESDGSRNFTELEVEMENKWGEFVKSGGAPAKTT